MAYSAISKPSLYFNTKTYNGNGGTQSITGVGFQPDMVWLKKRNGTANHHIVDAVRGVGYYIYPNLTNAQGGNGTSLITAFGADGWTMNDGADSNASGATGVGWAWKAGTGAGSSNTDGTINTTYTSANTTAGFSISKYSGTGSAGTVGHGLGVAPEMIMVKRLNTADGWTLFNSYLGSNDAYIYLNTNDASSTANGGSLWNSTAPTSSVFSLNTNSAVNGSGSTYIAYCFASKVGYSKFGKYIGNGSTDGTFVYTGFKPAFVICKKTDGADDWFLLDNKRDIDNPANHWLMADSSGAEQTSPIFFDFLSNGFKNRGTGGGSNASGGTYIYMAFAEEPLVANVGASIPATAR